MYDDSPEVPILPPSVERAIPTLRRIGWFSFWSQIVFAIFSFLCVMLGLTFSRGIGNNNSGGGPQIFFALTGLIVLIMSIYWASRYSKLSRQLATPNGKTRPKRSETLQLIERGLVINLVGLLFCLISAEAISGILLIKMQGQSAIQGAGGGFNISAEFLSKLIQPADIFTLAGITHSLVGHFIGLVASLWLLRSIGRS
jgi:Protein of unknown function (DUF3611)